MYPASKRLNPRIELRQLFLTCRSDSVCYVRHSSLLPMAQGINSSNFQRKSEVWGQPITLRHTIIAPFGSS
jgi:hypothetical protein